MTPYYADDLVTLYHADCREILPSLRADAVVTDPPYGLDFGYRSYDDSRAAWYELMDDIVPKCRAAAPFVVMPSSGIDRLPWWYANHPPDWLIAWHKGSPGHMSKVGFNDWESIVSWGRPKVPMHDYFSVPGGFRIDAFDGDSHPCPKPVEWARWLVSRATVQGGTVIDPFAGSGTTLVAAKDLGRRAIGIEIEERYCEIAATRCSQEVLGLLA